VANFPTNTKTNPLPSGANTMKIIKQDELQGCTFYLSGKLDATESLQINQAFEEACLNGKKFVIINCKELISISSAGLGAVMAHNNQHHGCKITLVLCNVSPKLKKMLRLLDFSKEIPIASNNNKAMAYLKRVL
jgi:anti-sigma B factor antagonist